mgnify:FL=1|tara:strand:+ start:309 stop:986 length:678 start_codon:yes stop_codon:yes gene_type:complete
MPTTKIVDIIDRASIILQDTSNVRYPNTELLKFFNDGQREVVLHRPDAKTVNASFNCIAGSKQVLPATALRLVDVVQNVGGRAVTQIDRKILDETLPDWHNQVADATKKIEHFVYDSADPKNFYVYPKATATMDLQLVYSTSPADIVISSFSTDTTVISVDDVYANCLLDFMLYRSYQKDSEYAGNSERSMMHYSAFANALGIKTRADSAVDPIANNADRNAQRL